MGWSRKWTRSAAAGLVAILAAGAVTVVHAEEADDAKSDRVPLQSFFKGKVVRVEGREIELHYDFEDSSQLQDFHKFLPFRLIQTIEYEPENGAVRVKGTGSMRHKAVFKERVRIQAKFQPFKNRDFGFSVTESRESEVHTLYCVWDKYFGATNGVTTHQNMVIKFIPRDPKVNKDGMQDWRYCGSRGPKPEIKRGQYYTVVAERGDNESLMLIDDEWKSSGKEAGRDLTTQMAAVYGVKADLRVDDIVIIGQLDPDYIEEHKLDMTELKPAKTETEETGPTIADDVAERIRATIAGWPRNTKPIEMARLLRDEAIPEPLRQEAVDKLLAAGKKTIVPFLLDGLSSTDEPSRRLSFAAFDGLVGKSFGYRPDASEAARSSAMKRINKHVQKNAAEFQ